MAVRDFVDTKGVTWKVWPVDPQTVYPTTASEDYLGEYEGGWLCFESAAERRRLPEFPQDWEQLSEAELRALLHVAAVVPKRKSLHLPPDPPPTR
jgi:hypothetical protein